MKEKCLHLIFPPRCALCGEVLAVEEWAQGFCADCQKEIPYIAKKRCPHCGGRTETAGFCDGCLKPYAFTSACAAFPYAKIRDAIHLFKYEGGIQIGKSLGRLMAAYLLQYHEELLVQTDVMLSVPLHARKEKQRGFNQTHILCEEISAATGLIFQKDGILRKRETIAQSTLDPGERKENLKDAFAVAADFKGKRILLVDDIFTTGATCNECARALYRAGAKAVMVFCLSAAGGKAEENEDA